MTDPRGRAPLDAALEEAQRLDRYLWAGLLFSAAIFAKFPALDLLVSSRYHHPERGFVLGEAAWVQALHAWTPRVGLTLVALLLLFLTLSPLLAWVLRHRAGWRDHLMGFGRRTAILAPAGGSVRSGPAQRGSDQAHRGRPGQCRPTSLAAPHRSRGHSRSATILPCTAASSAARQRPAMPFWGWVWRAARCGDAVGC